MGAAEAGVLLAFKLHGCAFMNAFQALHLFLLLGVVLGLFRLADAVLDVARAVRCLRHLFTVHLPRLLPRPPGNGDEPF